MAAERAHGHPEQHRNGAWPGTAGQDRRGVRGEEKKGQSRGDSGHSTLRYRCREDWDVGAVLLPTPLALTFQHWLKQSAGGVRGTRGDGSWKTPGKGAAWRRCHYLDANVWPQRGQSRGEDAAGASFRTQCVSPPDTWDTRDGPRVKKVAVSCQP